MKAKIKELNGDIREIDVPDGEEIICCGFLKYRNSKCWDVDSKEYKKIRGVYPVFYGRFPDGIWRRLDSMMEILIWDGLVHGSQEKEFAREMCKKYFPDFER